MHFKADDSNRSPYENLPEIEVIEDSFDRAAAGEFEERDFDDYLVDLYDYVGAYYGWSWTDFKQVPLPILKKFKKRLDKKFDNLEDEVFSYHYLAIMLALSKAFGGK